LARGGRLGNRTTILGIGVALAVAGCGSSARSIAGNGAASFIGRASNAVAFIQWTRAGNSVTGSLQSATFKQPLGSGLQSSQVSFTGTITGNGVTLQLNSALLGDTTSLNGQLGGSGFTLTFPGQHGSLIMITFTPAQTADYNGAVRELELSQYRSPCTLHLQGHDAELTVAGPAAQSECASFVAAMPAGETLTTQAPSSLEAENTAVCELGSGSNQVAVQDSGGQDYGQQACAYFSREGWAPTKEARERQRRQQEGKQKLEREAEQSEARRERKEQKEQRHQEEENSRIPKREEHHQQEEQQHNEALKPPPPPPQPEPLS
jgi:hypothetical protein